MMTLTERLRLFADDPMWADHAEVPKVVLARAADRIEALEAALEWAMQHVSKPTRLIRGQNDAHFNAYASAVSTLQGEQQ